MRIYIFDDSLILCVPGYGQLWDGKRAVARNAVLKVSGAGRVRVFGHFFGYTYTFRLISDF